jgi:CheY-like chemotaxis protein
MYAPNPQAPLVLVVDDHRDAADSLAQLLQAWGYRAVVAYGAAAALDAARREPPAAALLDLAMPGVGGCELARRLRQLPGVDGAPLIAMTGYGRDGDRGRCWEAGIEHFLLKPADPGGLRGLLARLL